MHPANDVQRVHTSRLVHPYGCARQKGLWRNALSNIHTANVEVTAVCLCCKYLLGHPGLHADFSVAGSIQADAWILKFERRISPASRIRVSKESIAFADICSAILDIIYHRKNAANWNVRSTTIAIFQIEREQSCFVLYCYFLAYLRNGEYLFRMRKRARPEVRSHPPRCLSTYSRYRLPSTWKYLLFNNKLRSLATGQGLLSRVDKCLPPEMDTSSSRLPGHWLVGWLAGIRALIFLSRNPRFLCLGHLVITCDGIM